MKIELLQIRLSRAPTSKVLIIDLNFLVEEKTIMRQIEFDPTMTILDANNAMVAPWKALLFTLNKTLLDIEKEVTFRTHSIDWADHLPKHPDDLHPDLYALVERLEQMTVR